MILLFLIQELYIIRLFSACLIQLFFEKFQRKIGNSIEIFRKIIIELEKA